MSLGNSKEPLLNALVLLTYLISSSVSGRVEGSPLIAGSNFTVLPGAMVIYSPFSL